MTDEMNSDPKRPSDRALFVTLRVLEIAEEARKMGYIKGGHEITESGRELLLQLRNAGQPEVTEQEIREELARQCQHALKRG